MVKLKTKKAKRIAAFLCAAAVVIVFSALPLLAEKKPENGGQASILTGTVATGNVNSEIVGGGTLALEDAAAISVPASVKMIKYLAANGDTVKEGDAIAEVDRVTVMTAIAEVQDTLDYLSEEIEAEGEKETASEVTALAGGTVKVLYAHQGSDVQDIMLEYGALAVLSLDNLMAVDFESESAPGSGTAVSVVLSGGDTAAGTVVASLSGEVTVTIEDHGYEVGETVHILSEDGTELGNGQLYIYSPWNATAYGGTINSVNVKEGDSVSAGEILMELTDTGYTAAYRQLVGQRQAYEELMLELFEMYQTETVSAPCDGVVSGVDESSLELSASDSRNYTAALLANAPNGDNSTLYNNYVGIMTAVQGNTWSISVNPQNIEITDYTQLSSVSLDTSAMIQAVQVTAGAVPVYELQNGTWVQIDGAGISAGDILLLSGSSSDNIVWLIRIQKSAQIPETPEETGEPGETEVPGETGEPGETQVPDEPEAPGEPEIPGTPDNQENPEIPDISSNQTLPSFSGSNTYPSGGAAGSGSGSYPDNSIAADTEPEYELYGLDVIEVAAVTPQETLSLEITVNELDISSLEIGMSADIQIDALHGEKFSATIADISNTGINNGGYSSFTVKLTLERTENMLEGMNATATMVTATASDVLTLPAEALSENGTETVVYTGYDEKKGILLNPVTVTVGASDGQTVEIKEGLSDGDTYYYAYYDTAEILSEPDFGQGGLFR
ncbi:MAG: HlyD family efflux transporter periplasmic adaptor subunit [Clostridiales bacterium]|nr:HlyD family efflux transporter periplasmic adaptor subunit [Clostridiales bacterium]